MKQSRLRTLVGEEIRNSALNLGYFLLFSLRIHHTFTPPSMFWLQFARTEVEEHRVCGGTYFFVCILFILFFFFSKAIFSAASTSITIHGFQKIQLT